MTGTVVVGKAAARQPGADPGLKTVRRLGALICREQGLLLETLPSRQHGHASPEQRPEETLVITSWQSAARDQLLQLQALTRYVHTLRGNASHDDCPQ